MRFRIDPFKLAHNVLYVKSIARKVWKPVLFVCIILLDEERRQLFLPEAKLVIHDGMWLGKIPGLENAGHAHYEGQTRNGRMQGHGILTLTDGTKYEGTFLRNQIIGNGRIKYPDGREYIGPIKRWKQYGVGQLICPDGTVHQTNAAEENTQSFAQYS